MKNITLENAEGKQETIYIEAENNEVWVGKFAFKVESGKPSTDYVSDGSYNFANGNQLEIEKGVVTSYQTAFQILNTKFDALTEVMVELLKTK